VVIASPMPGTSPIIASKPNRTLVDRGYHSTRDDRPNAGHLIDDASALTDQPLTHAVAVTVNVRVTKEPEHGTVETSATTSFPSYPKENLRHRCNEHKVRNQQVYYKSAEKYVGDDMLDLLVLFPAGFGWELHILFAEPVEFGAQLIDLGYRRGEFDTRPGKRGCVVETDKMAAIHRASFAWMISGVRGVATRPSSCALSRMFSRSSILNRSTHA
jgi:hypothetical protein